MNKRRRFLTAEESISLQMDSREVFFGNTSMGGIFHIRLIDVKTNKILLQRSIPNLLTDSMMHILGGVSGSNNYLNLHYPSFVYALGSGSTAPSRTDTKLEGQFASKADAGYGASVGRGYATSSTGEVYHYIKSKAVFLENEGNGNIREIGIFANGGSAPTFLFTRVLYKNESGIPDVLVKTTEQQLEIIYEFRVYPPMDVWTGSVTINGSSYDYTGSGINILNESIWGFYFGFYWYGFLTGFGGWGNIFRSAGPVGIIACPSASELINPTGSGQIFNGGSSVLEYIVGDNSFPYTSSFSAESIFERKMKWVIQPSEANYVTIPGILFNMSYVGQSAIDFTYFGQIQMIFDPPISKSIIDRLTLIGKLQWGRKVVAPE